MSRKSKKKMSKSVLACVGESNQQDERFTQNRALNSQK